MKNNMIKHNRYSTKFIHKIILLLPLMTCLFGCTATNTISKEEINNQNNASQIVTEVLFENDIDENASYNIRKDGYVVIQFDSSVSEMKYTRVVDQLRSDRMITGVWAEQSGVEVCPLR